MYMNLGVYLKNYRQYMALSQYQMSKELGITQSYLSLIERGHRTPKRIKKIALEKFPISKDFIFFLKETGAI